ncbi:MAG: manganese efflux pump MntP family protein [Clostridiales bacterium]|nr:manganese efflux pump MntP family protein [Clostridiales bacterium]
MRIIELFLLAVGLSMDAFAVAVCIGLAMPRAVLIKAVIVGLYFGVFQAVMPLIGYMAATFFADYIIAYDHWIAFALLLFLGGKMAAGSLKSKGCPDRECPDAVCGDRMCPGGAKPGKAEASVSLAHMLPLALATSIDALAVGVSFAFLKARIIPAVSFIGVTTLLLSIAGVKIGNVFGLRFKSKAELAGGVILVLIGFKILLEHMGIISF